MSRSVAPRHGNSPYRGSEREFFNRISTEADLNALFAGKQACPPLHSRGGVRYHFLIHYVEKGEGTFEAAGQRHALGRGDAFVIFPEAAFVYTASASRPWTYRWVGFAGRKAGHLLREAGLAPATPVFRARYNEAITRCLDEMVSCMKAAGRGHGPRADGYLYHLMAELIAAAEPPDAQAGTHDAYIQSAVEFIHTNFSRKVTVAGLARHVGFHPTYFSGMFRRKTGVSPQAYLVSYRMQRAKVLLATTALPINQVAGSVGYPDYYAFEKQFRKHAGASPTEFRSTSTPIERR